MSQAAPAVAPEKRVYKNTGSPIVISFGDGKVETFAAGARIESPSEDVTKSHAWKAARRAGPLQITSGTDEFGSAA